jgi:hypothetical protein
MEWRECRDRYKKLRKGLKRQVKTLIPQFHKDPQVRAFVKYVLRTNQSEQNEERIEKVATTVAILKFISVPRIVKKYMKDVQCLGPNGRSIRLEKVIAEGDHVRLFTGVESSGDKVVVKWYLSGKRTTALENSMYERLNFVEPCYSTEFELWGQPVLVMEKLTSLDGETDDIYAMGISVLRQLRELHKWGVHCDLKPGNIMKKRQGDGWKYLVIDYGGVATERYGYGFKRWIWSPRWTSQMRRSAAGKEIICTAYNDFIELGFTMQNLFNDRRGISSKQSPGKDPIRDGPFRGRLNKYIEYLKTVSQDGQEWEPVRETLISILSKK